MKEIIIDPQKSDYGYGYGILEINETTTLKEVLEYYKNNSKTWGTITIKLSNYDILREFDYDTWTNNYFYYHLSWELNIKVKEVEFEYCFMHKNITIKLK